MRYETEGTKHSGKVTKIGDDQELMQSDSEVTEGP